MPSRLTSIHTPHGDLALPAFFPDATRGVIRAADAADARSCGIEGLMVNTLHLSIQPGTTVIRDTGGIHAFTGFDGPMVSDSGGFQVYSLAAGGAKGVSIAPGGVTFKMQGQKKKRSLTPEKCIQYQVQMGTDILFALDDCPPDSADTATLRESVDRTLNWGRSCREALDGQVEKERPLLFAVVQGGGDLDQRQRCVDGLLEIGFDGFGFGGWPIADDGSLVDEVGRVAEMLPDDLPLHGLGIGKPDNLAAAWRMGYDTFDCTIPTRDARRGRLYVDDGSGSPGAYKYLRIEREQFARDDAPIEPGCDCICCTTYSRAYLHHLFEIGEGTGHRLATLHNLRYYTRLIEHLREEASS